MNVTKIVAVPEEGVGSAALFAALILGLGVREAASDRGFAAAVEAGVRAADATVIISNERVLSNGCDAYMTECVAESLDKPVWRVWVKGDGSVEEFVASGSKLTFSAWTAIHSVRTLNVAGPRASKWSGGEEATVNWLMRVLA